MTSGKDKRGFEKTGWKPLPWPPLLIFLFLAIAIAVSGFFYYQKQKKDVFHEQINQLKAIANLKAADIQHWLGERMGDARLITENRILTAELLTFLHNRSTGPRRESIVSWMESLRKNYHYQNVMLLDRSGEMVLALTGPFPAIGSAGLELIAKVRKRKEAVNSDLHRSAIVPFPHMDVAAPLLATGMVEGFVFLRIDPAGFLFPMIQSWPTPSPSAETLLVRREGNEVVFLNELRHRKNTTMKLRLPISKTNLPAVQAALGKTGAFSGSDYRGISVWSVIRAIPDSPWSIVAKVDRDEIERPIRRSALAIFLVALSLILAAALMILNMWQRQSTRFRLGRLEAESQKQALVQHFDYLTRYANDIIILTDEKWNMLEVNERALVTYGYDREELLKMNIRDLRVPEERDKLAAQMRQLDNKLGLVFETMHQKKDGSVFPVEVSARTITVNDKKYFQGIIRDISERKRAEDSLRESEERSRQTLENMMEGCQIIGFDWRYLYVNRAVVDHSHKTKEELLGRTMMEIYSGIENTRMFVVLRRCMEERLPQQMENEFSYPDGTKEWFELSMQPVPEGVFILSINISERKRTEEILRHEQTLYMDLVNALPAGMYRLRVKPAAKWHEHNWRSQVESRYFVDFVSDRFCEITGISREEFTANPAAIPDRIHPDDNTEFVRRNTAAILSMSAFSWEGRMTVPEKGTIWIRFESIPRLLENGDVIWTGIVNDISERKQAESQREAALEALRKSEKRLKETQEMARLGHWQWDVKTGDVEWSEEVYKIFQLDPDAFIPHIDSILELSPWPEDHERDKELIRLAMETHEKGTYEQRFLRPDKSIGYYHSTFQGNYDDKGNLIFIIGTVLDITERKRAEEEIKKLNVELEDRVAKRTDQLEAANKELEAFSYSVSHDLRSPLRAIEGFARIMLEEYAPKLDGEGRRLLDVIAGNTRKMGQLIDDLLAFSRLTRQPIAFEPVDMTDLAGSVFSELKKLEKKRRIEFKLNDLPACRGDRSLLRQVLQNLLANAIKFTRTKSPAHIEFGAQAASGETIYYVKDNGVGFDMEYAHKLFGVFQRLHGSEEFEGTGVGLAIVQRIVQHHGGRVWAKSSPRGGATFFFSLPAEAATGIKQPEASAKMK